MDEDRIPKDGPLLVHCASGGRSAAASAYLAGKGYDVLYVDDDWSAWVAAGQPVERGGAETAPMAAASAGEG